MCCGLFSHEARHTARTQHSTDTHSIVIYYSFILSVVHDNMYVCVSRDLESGLSKGISVRTRKMVDAA